MSFLDCSCISPTQVQPISIEDQYEDVSHQYLSSEVSECTFTWGGAGSDDITALSANSAHYQLLSELGKGFNNLSQVCMARHTPSRQLVAVKNTNLDECTEDELLQLMCFLAVTPVFPGCVTPVFPGCVTPVFPGCVTPVFPGCVTPVFPGCVTQVFPGCVTPVFPGCVTPVFPGCDPSVSWLCDPSVSWLCDPSVSWLCPQNEVLLSRLFRHPNLLTSRLVFSSCCQLWVLTPLMGYGSADSLLRTFFPDGMSESLIAYLLHGVLKALQYLHLMGYVHRGVKASHILLSGEGRVYLSGLHSVYSMMRDGKKVKTVFDMPHHSPALLPWLSPELLRQDLHGYGVKSDIYSLGIVVCELVSGRVPFQDMPPTQMLLQKLRGSHCCLLDVAPSPLGELGGLKVSRSGVDSGIGESVATGSLTRTATAERPQSPAPKNHSATLHNLVQLCLQQQPDCRPSASTLLTHAFFKQVKRHHTRDSFLSLMYPAVPLGVSSPDDPSVSCSSTPSCHPPTSAIAHPTEEVWDFS
ncbi:STE20-related kinase adapter protein beta isoform X3 [Salvelinus namaycush]|uniref:STE20-related kinase adapter protein beta isoform X3 n=1 Tax=Salvelinus namaycush TaxID=8040 RepID=A0A8U0UJB9_SALNM|nr:STE20-related kinase adapter protein beta isoform X3 [Salvelinus namaycush]XP_038854339.1 STE20-related kinase adapter protein beta isoform X3 [Salvelinus namaycush]XP_038854340.1 STE20-related kinase adapter protein beta isoform X3 [Salvelinus namaycush]